VQKLISNLLIHREYTNAFPAKFIIDRDKFFTENGNKPHGHGLIHSDHLAPFPKNPCIARVFKEIGKADELGSGTRNLFKYCKTYCGHDPQLFEEDIFRFTLPLTPQATPQAERIDKLLVYCQTPRTRDEIQDFLGYKDRKYFRKEILNPLLQQKLLNVTIPDKLTSPNQKYYSQIAEHSA
jgi:ATP-dependent DNA helicase RecG